MWCPGEQCWAADSDSSPCVLCPLDSGNSESGLGLVSYLVSFVQGGMMRSSTIAALRSSSGSVRNQFGRGSPGEASILVKVSQQDKAWLWSLLEKQKSRRTGTGSALQVCPNTGGDCAFSPLAGVWPPSLSLLPSFKGIRTKEMKERGRGHSLTFWKSRGDLCITKV